MRNKRLHIISFDNPYPANYGGVIDVFYKIKALHRLGFEIYLHCFCEDRNEVSEPLKNCTKAVYLYKKNRKISSLFSTIPISVRARIQPELIDNLKAIEAPILFEGLQSTMVLNKDHFAGRKKYLRLHNVESKFYLGMSQSETNWFKKGIYFLEALKYKTYEQQLRHFEAVFTLSKNETDVVSHWTRNVHYIPVFHGSSDVAALSEYGKYALYHGDLRLPDNRKAVLFLISVFQKIPHYKFFIASSNGKEEISSRIKNHKNMAFFSLGNETQLEDLLANAHINVMLSFQQSGTKLKAINTLFKSRFCVINQNMVDDERLLSLCVMAETEKEFEAKIKTLIDTPYRDNENRKKVLSAVLSDDKNAMQLAAFLE